MDNNENTETKTSVIESLVERVEEYGRTSYELIRLKTIDKVSGTLSSVVSRLCAVIFLFIFIIIFHIALGLWLGELLGKGYYGFFCVAALDIIIWGILNFLMYNWVKKQISNSIISQLLNN
ncbi:MAG: hypothetical protein ACT4ON_00135 [Bacteroidota bacterium]